MMKTNYNTIVVNGAMLSEAHTDIQNIIDLLLSKLDNISNKDNDNVIITANVYHCITNKQTLKKLVSALETAYTEDYEDITIFSNVILHGSFLVVKFTESFVNHYFCV